MSCGLSVAHSFFVGNLLDFKVESRVPKTDLVLNDTDRGDLELLMSQDGYSRESAWPVVSAQ